MRMPADDFRLTCRSKGRPGGRKGSITPTKVVTCDTFEFSSLPGSVRPA